MIRIVRPLRRLRRDQRGATIVETALVLPAFIMLIIGGMYLGLLGFTVAGMHYAVQEGARCSPQAPQHAGTSSPDR